MRISIMRLTVIFLAILLPALLLSAQETTGIVASVNDDIITYGDVRIETRAPMEQLERMYRANPGRMNLELERTKIFETAIESLVQRKLILQEFERKEFVLPEDVIDDYVAEQIRLDYDDRVDFIKTLEANGVTFESYRRTMRERYIVEALSRQNVSSDVVIVSPYKIQRYYLDHKSEYELTDRVKLRMIMISGTKHGERARPMAEEIITKLDAGVPFGEMARIYSDDSYASQGGEWGWVEKGTFREDMADVIFSLESGKNSGIVEIGADFYIMFVEEKENAKIRPLKEVEDEIEAKLMDEERNRRRQKWIDRLKKQSFIQYY